MVHPLTLPANLFRVPPSKFPRIFSRYKSIRAAIERGINDSRTLTSHRRSRELNGGAGGSIEHSNLEGRYRSMKRDITCQPINFKRTYPAVAKRAWKERLAQQGPPTRQERELRVKEERENKPSSAKETSWRAPLAREHVPELLPYTTAASEFLYGYSVVLAALKADRRKLYNLYIHTRGLNHEGRAALVARARMVGVKIHEVGDEWLRVLDKTASGRPHNGFILEASPLPRPPITQLGAALIGSASFKVERDKQSREDAIVNGTQEEYSYKSAGWRHPLLLYVDGVLDEGNLGAIARSAYFLGVDAIATPTRQSAPWSHIALKASAGAAEAIPIFAVAQPSSFLMKSALRGWRIYASDAIPPEIELQSSGTTSLSPMNRDEDCSSKVLYTFARSSKRIADHFPVASHPTILMMGAEGSGLRTSLINQAHYKVGIRAGRDVGEVGVDSLNVSVAASLLCYEFLKRPRQERKPGEWLF